MLPWEVTQVLAPERESPVALNMVIAQDTEYVLLDEPTNDLDIHHAANLMKTVRRLCDELSKTVILVLHDFTSRFLPDYICALQDGRVAKLRHWRR